MVPSEIGSLGDVWIVKFDAGHYHKSLLVEGGREASSSLDAKSVDSNVSRIFRQGHFG